MTSKNVHLKIDELKTNMGLIKNLEFSINAGYLFADDALDAFEVGELKDGSSDEDILVSTSRLRLKF